MPDGGDTDVASPEAVLDEELAAARDCAGGARWLGEEVASSERPELATAKVVVSGPKLRRDLHSLHRPKSDPDPHLHMVHTPRTCAQLVPS